MEFSEIVNTVINITSYIESFLSSSLSCFSELSPWEITNNSSQCVRKLMTSLLRDEFTFTEEIAVHNSATIESGAILKGPIIIGPRCFVAAGTYIRGGNWLEADCILGPSVELKSSFIFSGSKLAHFNFVGDSILGRNVNLEAGSIIANYRNELDNKEIQIFNSDKLIKTGIQKFGALLGDDCRIGANAVIAPGALILQKSVVGRLALIDQQKDVHTSNIN